MPHAPAPAPRPRSRRISAVLVALFATVAVFGQSGNRPLFQLGRLEVRPRVSYSWSREEGTLIRPGQPATSDVQSVSPGVSFNLGAWAADYSSRFAFYSNPAVEDSVSHSLSLSGGTRLGNLAAQFGQTVSQATASSFQTGRITEQLTTSSTLGVGYPLTTSLQLAGSLGQSLRFVEAAPDSATWDASLLASYYIGGGLRLAAGATAGYTAIYKTADSVFVGPRATLSWTPRSKLSFSLQSSLNQRMTYTQPRYSESVPTYSGSISYAMFSHTLIGVTTSRSRTPSLLDGLETESSEWGLSLSQRLLGKLNLILQMRSGTDRYFAIDADGVQAREDGNESFTASLSTAFMRRGSIAITYSRSRNESSDALFAAEPRQISVALTYSY